MNIRKPKNLSALFTFAKTEIIYYTEKINLLHSHQKRLLDENPLVRQYMENYYEENNPNYVPGTRLSTDQLAVADLPNFENLRANRNASNDFKEFLRNYRAIKGLEFTKGKFENLSNIFLQKRGSSNVDKNTTTLNPKIPKNVSPARVNAFLNKELELYKNNQLPNLPYADRFGRFAQGVKIHSPFYLSYFFRDRFDKIAERYNLKDRNFYINASNAFTANHTEWQLDRNFQGHLKSSLKKLALATALSATLAFTIPVITNHDKTNDITSGQTITHTDSTFVPDNESIPKTTKIFRNSYQSYINTYDNACSDYFEKISDLYKYYSGKDINLSEYQQKHIGRNSDGLVYEVEKDGQTYLISAQSTNPSNAYYLKTALEGYGAKVTSTNRDFYYIVDKENPERSLVIADRNGNPIRSGNVLMGNGQYNTAYVNAGRKILNEQGITNPSEGDCLSAFLLSSTHSQDNDLAQALGDVSSLTEYIKDHFYLDSNGRSDPYTVQLYKEKSRKFSEEKTNNTIAIDLSSSKDDYQR